MGKIVIASLLIYTFLFFNIRWCSCKGNSPNNSTLKCIPSERAALLKFKQNLTYFDKNVSSSWEGEECCEWSLVNCDSITGHVIDLDLSGYDTNNNLLKMEKFESLVYLLELTQMWILDLSYNSFNYSSVPKIIGSMKQLRYLYLSNASFVSLPYELGNLTNLEYLELANNSLSGKIPTSIGKLSKLQILDISNNPMKGTVLSNPHFANLSSLIEVHMDDSMLTLNLSSNWMPPFQIYLFYADNCKINGQLPPWLQTQKSLGALSLSNANISGTLPEDLGHTMPNLKLLFLPNNQITGQIPDTICQLTSLNFLDINNNSLSGEIPNCFAKLSNLTLVELSYNKLNGHIPCFNNSESYHTASFGMDFSLHLSDNMLSGEIPSCLSDLTNLNFLDIGRNQLSGKMHKWFNAEKFRELQMLRLRGNKFSGTIPKQICSLPHLQIMDLGHNYFTGYIPRCLSNLTSMTSPNASQIIDTDDNIISEVIQGIERSYSSSLSYLVDIDLSCNNLVGSIPDDMTKISGLLTLNLSYNQLSGIIPKNIGALKSLISLDLSNNKLRGSIPRSIGEIYRLSSLNLSYNNLSGQIPIGNQLQTLSDQASIYAGNPYLCGVFLPNKCKSEAEVQEGRTNKGKGNNKKLEKMGFSLVVMSGFASGFWGVVGGLVVNRRWRHAVFRRVEDGYNCTYVIVAVGVAKARRVIRR